jgi:phosphonate transport system substrate-binding protein
MEESRMLRKLVKVASLALAAMLAVSALAACSAAPASANGDGKTPDTITIVWYPNESAADYQSARDEFGKLITQATGKPVKQQLTTDYNIAIEALASGNAQICFMGAQGFVVAQSKNKDVLPLFTNSGDSGTLDDAIYYSWMCVLPENAAGYMDGGKFSIQNIQGKRFSFVSNSSTSGFKIPTTNILNTFKKMDQWKDMTTDDLVQGGSGKFFSEVLFGGSHQGSMVNLLTEKADVAAFCDTEAAPYTELVSGQEETAGAIYKVKDGATAPFDTLVGKQFELIQSTPVQNGPFAYNSNVLSASDVKKLQDLFTSDAVTNNPNMFKPKDSNGVAFFKQNGKNRFVVVEDKWYDPIRALQNQ